MDVGNQGFYELHIFTPDGGAFFFQFEECQNITIWDIKFSFTYIWMSDNLN